MADNISMIKALLKKLPDFDPNQDCSLNDYLKRRGLKFDETTLKYRMDFTSDSTLSDSETLILVSEIFNRYVKLEGSNLNRPIKREVEVEDSPEHIQIDDLIEEFAKFKIEELEKKEKDLEKELEKVIHSLEEMVLVEQSQDDYRKIEEKVLTSQELIHELQTEKTQLEDKILRLKALIPPVPVSEETSHCLTVTSLKEANWYRLGRVQKRSIKSRLELIAREEGCTYEEIEKRTKIFKNIPNSIVTAGHLREYLRKCGWEVEGKVQKIMFHGGDDALYAHIRKFIRL